MQMQNNLSQINDNQTNDYEIIDLKSEYGLIEVSGPDAETFLQGQLTCDMHKISNEFAALAAYCNIKGRIRALFRILKCNDAFLLLLPKAILNNTLTQLKKPAMFSKVKLKDASMGWNYYGIVKVKIEAEIESENNKDGLFDQQHFFKIAENTKDANYSRGIMLLPIEVKIEKKIEERIEEKKLHAQHANSWTLLDILSGIPQIWPETVELFLPHELNLPQLGAVSFNKGCYCGQEIIARMEYRAKLKRHLYRGSINALIETLPHPGTPIFVKESDQSIGTVVSAGFSKIPPTPPFTKGGISIPSNNSNITIELLIEILDEYANKDSSQNLYLNILKSDGNVQQLTLKIYLLTSND